MTVDVGPTCCGEITDGVALNNGQGAWVIDYADLLRIAKAATKARPLVAGGSDAERAVENDVISGDSR